jgi:hypothetical protein
MEELTQKLSEQMETMNGALEKGFTESKEVQERLVERLREVERTNRSQSETVERPKGAIASPAKSSTPSTMTTTSNTTTHRELIFDCRTGTDLGEQDDEEVNKTTPRRRKEPFGRNSERREHQDQRMAVVCSSQSRKRKAKQVTANEARYDAQQTYRQ